MKKLTLVITEIPEELKQDMLEEFNSTQVIMNALTGSNGVDELPEFPETVELNFNSKDKSKNKAFAILLAAMFFLIGQG